METKNNSTSENSVYTYSLVIERKHGILINEEGRRLLIDTGSPINIGNPFMLCGEIQNSSNLGMLSQIKEHSGLELIDGLIGMCTLRKWNLRLDYPNKKVQFSSTPFEMPGCKTAIHTLFGMAIFFDATLDGTNQKRRVILDSGAPISYINPELVKNQSLSSNANVPIDFIHDFHPEIGEFTVPIYPEMQMSIGNGAYRLPVNFGILPSTSLISLSTSVLSDAIIGYDLLSKVSVSFNWSENTMTICNSNNQ